jgi:hypothetical protein
VHLQHILCGGALLRVDGEQRLHEVRVRVRVGVRARAGVGVRVGVGVGAGAGVGVGLRVRVGVSSACTRFLASCEMLSHQGEGKSYLGRVRG